MNKEFLKDLRAVVEFKPRARHNHYICYSFLRSQKCEIKHKKLSTSKKHCFKLNKQYFSKNLAIMEQNR